jgi:hypothetical protein
MSEPSATYSIAALTPRNVRYVDTTTAPQEPARKPPAARDPQLAEIIERLARIEAKLFVIANVLTEQSTQK